MVYTTLAALLLTAQPNWAGNLTVTTTADSGRGSLRWAIGRANAHDGVDFIDFDFALTGDVIQPLTPLPPITDDYTYIDGDTGIDFAPDIILDGSQLDDIWADYGLQISADGCRVEDMVIVNFPHCGIDLLNANECFIAGCHLGVNRAGTVRQPTGLRGDIVLNGADDNRIQANIMGAGDAETSWGAGITIWDGDRNWILQNKIGLTRAGDRALGEGERGIFFNPMGGQAADMNVIGEQPGPMLTSGNLIAGARTGISIDHNATNTQIKGNTFGLAADGDTRVPIEEACIAIDSGGSGTQIGGTVESYRNVFAGGAAYGVVVSSSAATDIMIQGNYFGSNAAGAALKALTTGVRTYAPEGTRVTIGGPRRHPRQQINVREGGDVLRREATGSRSKGVVAKATSPE